MKTNYLKVAALAVAMCVTSLASAVDWSSVAWAVNGAGNEAYTEAYKIYCENSKFGFVNIQSSFGTEPGFYCTFGAADFSVEGLSSDQYATQGAGMLFYVSAFVAQETLVKITAGGELYDVYVYYKNGIAGGDEEDAEAPVLTSATLESVTYNSAVIAVSATDNVGVARYVVTDEAKGINQELSATEGKITVKDLEAETAYSFVVKAKDLAGNLSDGIIVEATTAVKPDIIWSDYVLCAGGNEAYANQFKVENVSGVRIDVIQNPAWENNPEQKSGIYLIFESAINSCDVASAIQGAGLLLFVDDLTAQITTVNVETAANGTITFRVWNEEGTSGPTTIIENVQVTNIYAVNGMIHGAEDARIYTISGLDVTKQNGALAHGVYVVKMNEKVQKVLVK